MTSQYTEARKRVEANIEGLECAAEISRAIVKVYQAELDAFSASKAGDGSEPRLRIIRAVLDERGNAERLEKEIADLRTILALSAPPVTVEEVAAMREIVELARELINTGLVNRGVDRGLVVVEKRDKSDPHYRLCTALERFHTEGKT